MTTSLRDIYLASGGQDTGQGVIPPPTMEPFHILLKVVPTAIEMDTNRKERVTFAVILDSEPVISNAGGLNLLTYFYPEAEVQLPVDQVHIRKPIVKRLSSDELLELYVLGREDYNLAEGKMHLTLKTLEKLGWRLTKEAV